MICLSPVYARANARKSPPEPRGHWSERGRRGSRDICCPKTKRQQRNAVIDWQSSGFTRFDYVTQHSLDIIRKHAHKRKHCKWALSASADDLHYSSANGTQHRQCNSARVWVVGEEEDSGTSPLRRAHVVFIETAHTCSFRCTPQELVCLS